MNLKQCPKCKRILTESYFAPNSKNCKICRRDYDWQYRYGISPEQYYELYLAQDGKCKICGHEPKGDEYLCIDHNKKTGEVRGLLCGDCNRGIGMFKEIAQNFKNAIDYITGGNN